MPQEMKAFRVCKRILHTLRNWFCGKLGRSGAMLLLKEGTSLFSDFGGIITKRFAQNISEKVVDIKKDLVATGRVCNSVAHADLFAYGRIYSRTNRSFMLSCILPKSIFA
jgi:hypothetical protein